MVHNFTIVVDTREQQPWLFEGYATAHRKLDTGDYAIEGLEDILCIERKKDIAEIANNMVEDRFKDVIERMSKYKHSFLLIECEYDQLSNYPVGSGIPEKLWKNIKIKPDFILKFLMELIINNNIHIIFCGSPASSQKIALSIMKRIYAKYKQ